MKSILLLHLCTVAFAYSIIPTLKSQERRSFIRQAAAALITSNTFLTNTKTAQAVSTTSTAEITDKIYIDLQGLAPQNEATAGQKTQRIVIGLFGKDAPQPVSTIIQLASPNGLASKCKPRAEKLLQREQLESNKVYNSCVASEDVGVTYDLSSVWRIIKDERIDVGSVSGRFISRENPTFSGANDLKHDVVGTVSVRKGSDGGFGFTVSPSSSPNTQLDEDNIVIGRIIDGLEVMDEVNSLPVVSSAKGLNYMKLTGGPSVKDAPSRACRYGGPMYCNENKPLKKLMVVGAGVL